MYNLNNKERMQKVFLIFFVGVLGAFIGQLVQGTSADIDDVLLENVESLSDMEVDGPINCKFSGDLTCPGSGDKFKIVYKGYSLR